MSKNDKDQDYKPDLGENGRFERKSSQFRNWISREKGSDFPPEANRYHIYASYACPWAHRTLIMRKLKNLESVVSVSIVEPYMPSDGWQFSHEYPDTAEGSQRLSEIYRKAQPNYEGRFTVPVLWDKASKTIVSNESADIIRMLNSEFADFTDVTYDFYPRDLRAEIERTNDLIYATVNNGVYRAGFAETQHAYEEAFDTLFETLDDLEETLSQKSFLVGERLTEADIRLFTTLVRFDAVYHNHFKCNKKKIAEYPALSRYLERLYRLEGVAETVKMDHIKVHYYKSHKRINPLGIVPTGPDLPFLD